VAAAALTEAVAGLPAVEFCQSSHVIHLIFKVPFAVPVEIWKLRFPLVGIRTDKVPQVTQSPPFAVVNTVFAFEDTTLEDVTFKYFKAPFETTSTLVTELGKRV
jgi:hypothetical protein